MRKSLDVCLNEYHTYRPIDKGFLEFDYLIILLTENNGMTTQSELELWEILWNPLSDQF